MSKNRIKGGLDELDPEKHELPDWLVGDVRCRIELQRTLEMLLDMPEYDLS